MTLNWHRLTRFAQQTTFGHLCDGEQCDVIRCGNVRLLRSHPLGQSIDKLANCHGSEYYGETEKGSRP